LKTSFFIGFFLVIFSNHFQAQIDVGFVNHLNENNLINEHRHYLSTFPQEMDSIQYYQAKFNAKYFNDSLFLFHYFKSITLCNNDSVLIENASVAFLRKGRALNTQKWFKTIDTSYCKKNVKDVQLLLIT
jgi:hypothetical protein